MIGQPIVGSIEIEPLVFDACPKIPLPGDKESMSVAKIIVERVAVAELAVVVEETAVSGVVHLVIKKIAMIFIRWRGRRLGLIYRGASDDGGDGDEKQADKAQLYVFHRLRRLGYISDKPANPDVSAQKNSGKVIIRESRESLRHATSRAPSRSAPTQVWCNPRLRFRLIVLEREGFSV